MTGQLRPFGRTRDGREVGSVDIANGGIRATILTYGAIVHGVWLDGISYSLTRAGHSLADYETTRAFHGSLVGPVCNRLTDARAPISGQTTQFEVNYNGRHCLHSASGGTHLKVWQIDDIAEAAVSLKCRLVDGEAGFPGNRDVTVRYEISETGMMTLTVETRTDAATLVNFTNHSYWNLDGTETFEGHHLTIDADHFLPTTDEFIPTGVIRPVDGRAQDYRDGRTLVIDDPPLDNTFVPNTPAGTLRDVLWLTGRSGLTMTVATTEPGVHVYDHRAPEPAHAALAVECQGWPDAPNQPGFPSIELAAGETRQQVTSWRFRPG